MENGLPFATLEATPKAASNKRHRVALSGTQSSQLERLFAESKYPDYKNLQVLSKTINLSYKKILVWFKNRRAKDKRSRKVNYGPHDFVLDRMAAASVATAPSPPATPFASYSSTTQHQNQQLINIQLQQTQCYTQQQYHQSHLYHYCSPAAAAQHQQHQHQLHHQYQHHLVVSPQTPDFGAPSLHHHQVGYLSGFAREDVGVSPPSASAAAATCSPSSTTTTLWNGLLQAQPHQSSQYQHNSYYGMQQQQQQRCLPFQFMPGGTGSTPMMQSRML